MKYTLALATLMLLGGCVKSTLEISKCNKYENGICITKEKRTVHICKNPTIVDKHTYCDR